jgi:hypothetical protein
MRCTNLVIPHADDLKSKPTPLTATSMLQTVVHDAEEVAGYMEQLFIAESRGENIEMPRWPLDLLEECGYAVKMLIKAAQNQSEFFEILQKGRH